ncbi:MAG: lysophospholipid acyltransferase family protein [Deltaproteobacteria bacterium]|nr:lysophospholipid acyltransferase family protein [Deltaproteobacteria bacterium]
METSLSYRHPFEGPLWRRVFLLGVQHFPRPVQVATMPFWAALFFGPLPRVWRTCGRNLDRLDGPLPPGAREVRTYRLMVNYAQAITDAYRCHVGGAVPVTAVYHGRERLAAARARGRGVIIVTGHLGAWQLGPYLLAREGVGPLTVAMAQEPNPALQRFMESFPRPFRIVYSNGSTFGTLALRTTLTAGGVVAMQLDRPLGEAHVTLPFAGGAARFATGPAALARTTGAALVPAFLTMGPGAEVHVHVEAPIIVRRTRDRAADLAASTQAAVACYEQHARAAPLQWFNFYDFWEAP